MSFCTVPGCARRATGYSRFCETHRSRDRRHGDPEQRSVRVEQLKPYVQLVRRQIAKRGGDDLWAKLELVWAGVLEAAQGILADYRSGRPMLRHEVQAAQTLVGVSSVVPVRRIVETVAALTIMGEREPRAFKSDRATWVQTARRFRSLSDVACVKYWDAARGKTKRVYRNFSRLAGETLGRMLMEGLGAIGLHIHRADERERQNVQLAKAQVYAALAASLTNNPSVIAPNPIAD